MRMSMVMTGAMIGNYQKAGNAWSNVNFLVTEIPRQESILYR